MSKKYLYKFLDAGLKSHYDGSKWRVGEWRTVPKPIVGCVGLNASEYIQQAIGYVQGKILAKVECGGKIIKGYDKWTCEKMRIVAVADWTWRESVGMAVYASRHCLPVFEKEYPDDNRPRMAIEEAEEYLRNPCSASAERAASAATTRAIHRHALSLVKWSK